MSKRAMFGILGCGWDGALVLQALRDVGVPSNDIEIYSHKITDEMLEHLFIPWLPDSRITEPMEGFSIPQHLLGGDILAYVERKWRGVKIPKPMFNTLAQEELEAVKQDLFYDLDNFEKILGNQSVSMTMRLDAGDIRDIALVHDLVFQTFPTDEAKKNGAWRGWIVNMPILVYPREMLGEEDINDLRNLLPKALRSNPHFRILNGVRGNGHTHEWWRATYFKGRLYFEYPPAYDYPDGDKYFGKYSVVSPIAQPWVEPNPQTENLFLVGQKAEVRGDLGFGASYGRALEILNEILGEEEEE